MRLAVIDVGSNSVLMTAADCIGGQITTLVEMSKVTALGEGAKLTGILGQTGIEATLGALRDAFEAARCLQCDEVVAMGTMALRIASNAQGFLEAASNQGTPVQVLSGEREADLGFAAVANDLEFANQGPLCVIDVGGQSTEVVANDQELRRSFPIGALGLRSTTMEAESPSFSSRLRAMTQVDEMLADIPPAAGGVVALGATGVNLVSIREGLTNWEPDRIHGAPLSYEEISRAVGWLCDMDDAARGGLVGIEPGRERTLHIGCLILERCLYALRAEGCLVSVRGWRHGLLQEIASSKEDMGALPAN